jgi:obg-like ATPase 1
VTDIAGLVRGAATGAGLGNAFLSHIQAVDGVFHVVRAFDSDEVVHVDDSVDPVRDLETIQHELCAKDLEYTERAVADEVRDVKRSQGMKLSALFIATTERVMAMLKDDKPIRGGVWNSAEVELIRNKLPNLITTKPVVYLVNLSKDDFLRKKNKWLAKIHAWIQAAGGGVMIPFSVEFEQALWEARDNPDARAALEDVAAGGAKSVLPKIVKQGYAELSLIYFFTAGEKEVRCWTVQEGALAPQAAGVIHSDFERGFIKAEVVSYADFREHSKGASMGDVKAAGKYRIEGKQYVVQSGDICHFQFNVTTSKK